MVNDVGSDQMLIFQQAYLVINLMTNERQVVPFSHIYDVCGYQEIMRRINLNSARKYERQFYITVVYKLAGIVTHTWSRNYRGNYYWIEWDTNLPPDIELQHNTSITDYYYIRCEDIDVTHIERSRQITYYSDEFGAFLILLVSTTMMHQRLSQPFLFELDWKQARI